MSELAIPITCTLCNRKFYGPGAALTGDQHAHGAPRLLQQLMKHIAEAHPENFAGAQILAAEYQGWRILSLYETADPKVIAQFELFRWKIHQASLRCRAQNLDVRAQQVADAIMLEFDGEDGCPNVGVMIARHIQAVLEELRDILEEPNLYTPEAPPEPPKSPLVTA